MCLSAWLSVLPGFKDFKRPALRKSPLIGFRFLITAGVAALFTQLTTGHVGSPDGIFSEGFGRHHHSLLLKHSLLFVVLFACILRVLGSLGSACKKGAIHFIFVNGLLCKEITEYDATRVTCITTRNRFSWKGKVRLHRKKR
ncbi:hypothetical protein L596_007334 [Steinernema carpocapsae]|uniref:Uncharacterized protein n=1 Tax=Steinernema carpocapsae TaxID=34508 RepID=A0A4U5PA00_STECR|nr:hypothetical protein L596_007334 [Steinernema carpocapsae]